MNVALNTHHATIIRTARRCKIIPVILQEVNLTKSIYVCDEGIIKMMTDKVNIAYEIFDKNESFDVIIETNNPYSSNFPRFIKLLNAQIEKIRFVDCQGTHQNPSSIAEITAICNKWTYAYNYKSKEKVKVMLI